MKNKKLFSLASSQGRICSIVVFVFWSLASLAQNSNSQELMESANQGDPELQFEMGTELYNKRDYVKAFEWYSKAAAQGYAKAEYNVGYFYENGVVVEKNVIKAFEWYSKAATQGLAAAECAVGYCYEEGEGIEKNIAKAFEWYSKAATQGLAAAERSVGRFYYKGMGVEKNATKAFEWYSKAAAQGDAMAQYILALFYTDGTGVVKNEGKGWMWMVKAANNGYLNAQISCYQNYKAAGSNWTGIAMKYILLASQQGADEAKSMFKEVVGISYDNLEKTYKSKIKTYIGEYPLPLRYYNAYVRHTGNCTYQYYEIGDLRIYHGIFEYTSKEKVQVLKDKAIPKLTINGNFKDDYRDGVWKIKYRESDVEYNINVTYRNGIFNGPFTYQKKYTSGKNIQITAEYKDNIIVKFKRQDSTGFSVEAYMDDDGFLHGPYLAKDSEAIIKGDFIHGNSDNVSNANLQTGGLNRKAMKKNSYSRASFVSIPWYDSSNVLYGLHKEFKKGLELSSFAIGQDWLNGVPAAYPSDIDR